MRHRETGMYNSFEEFERAELRQLDSSYIDDMNTAFFDEGPHDGLRAVSLYDDEE